MMVSRHLFCSSDYGLIDLPIWNAQISRNGMERWVMQQHVGRFRIPKFLSKPHRERLLSVGVPLKGLSQQENALGCVVGNCTIEGIA